MQCVSNFKQKTLLPLLPLMVGWKASRQPQCGLNPCSKRRNTLISKYSRLATIDTCVEQQLPDLLAVLVPQGPCLTSPGLCWLKYAEHMHLCSACRCAQQAPYTNQQIWQTVGAAKRHLLHPGVIKQHDSQLWHPVCRPGAEAITSPTCRAACAAHNTSHACKLLMHVDTHHACTCSCLLDWHSRSSLDAVLPCPVLSKPSSHSMFQDCHACFQRQHLPHRSTPSLALAGVGHSNCLSRQHLAVGYPFSGPRWPEVPASPRHRKLQCAKGAEYSMHCSCCARTTLLLPKAGQLQPSFKWSLK